MANYNRLAINEDKIDQIERNIATLREQKINVEMAIARIEDAYEHGNYSEEKMAEKVSEKTMKLRA